ncbi:MAG: hypothetical protein V3573_13395 [Desulfovibrionaceae bacterium]
MLWKLLIGLISIVSLFCLQPAFAVADVLVRTVNFTDYVDGSIEDWLAQKGFRLEQDATKRDRIDLDVGPRGLVLTTKRPSLGLLPNESIDIPDFSYMEIDWGVNRHPAGASYEQSVRNEAIMVITFLGDERLSSGSLFIPDSPYFIGLFLCSGDDKINYPYVGAYFKKGGRYICVDRPQLGQIVTSRFDIMTAYRSYFDKEGDDDPAISGIALALDTQKAKGKEGTEAFIREIRFYR